MAESVYRLDSEDVLHNFAHNLCKEKLEIIT